MAFPTPLPVRKNREVKVTPPQGVTGKLRTGRVIDFVDIPPCEDPQWVSKWIWGGLYCIDDEPKIIKALMEHTLQKSDWFGS